MELLKDIGTQVLNMIAIMLMVFFIFLCGFAFADESIDLSGGHDNQSENIFLD